VRFQCMPHAARHGIRQAHTRSTFLTESLHLLAVHPPLPSCCSDPMPLGVLQAINQDRGVIPLPCREGAHGPYTDDVSLGD
jgi:hypothetical protein